MTTYDWESDYGVRGKISAGKQAEGAGDAVLLGSNGKIPDKFISGSDYKYSLTFDSATFATDPTGCLTYADDAVGFTRVDGSSASALTSHGDGSWGNDNPLIDSMFYATFDSDGSILHILDPEDLTQDTSGVDRSSEITTNNVMLVIPTLYSKRDSSGISISSKASQGTPYAHTYGGHTYKYLAVGVYEGTISDGKLMSVSGAVPARNQTRAAFRSYANANGTNWMLTNWHVRQLIRDLDLMITKSFDSQRQVGQGFSSGGSNSNPEGLTTGLGNALGRYAGNPSGTSDVVKMLIENPWASKWEFVDDVVTALNSTYNDYRDVYVGQSLVPDDDYTGMTKVAEIVSSNYGGSTNAFANSIVTDNEAAWGMFADYAGSDSTGLCDKHWSNPSSQRLCLWGGTSVNGSADGVSCLLLDAALSNSYWSVGARPAFVFD